MSFDQNAIQTIHDARSLALSGGNSATNTADLLNALITDEQIKKFLRRFTPYSTERLDHIRKSLRGLREGEITELDTASGGETLNFRRALSRSHNLAIRYGFKSTISPLLLYALAMDRENIVHGILDQVDINVKNVGGGLKILSAEYSGQQSLDLPIPDIHDFEYPSNDKSIPHQSPAPVKVVELDGRITRVIDNADAIGADELDFDRWRAPVADSLAELLDTDLAPGTNHERLRRRLVALAAALAGTIDDVKANQFRLGYGIESLGDLVGVYRDAADDMPTLNAAVFADVNRLHIQLMLGLSKLVAWSRFQRDADADALHEGDADPTAVGAALAEAEAVLSGDAAAPIVDPELPRSFRWIRDAIADPKETTKRMVYGAVKSLENVVSFLGQIALRTARGTAEGVSTGISKAVAASLLIGLGGAALTLSGALPTQWAWLKPLLEAAAKLLHG